VGMGLLVRDVSAFRCRGTGVGDVVVGVAVHVHAAATHCPKSSVLLLHRGHLSADARMLVSP
jgi:hypothetical protein